MIKNGIIAFAAGLIALGGGFYVRLYQEGGLPQTILERSFDRMSEITSVVFKGSITVAEQTTTPPRSFMVNFDGASDTTDPAKPKGAFTVTAAVPAEPELNQFVEAGNVKLEFRFIGTTGYIRLAAIPKAAFDLGSLVNQWVVLDSAALGAPEPRTISPEKIKQVKAEFLRAKILRIVRVLGDQEIGGEQSRGFNVIIAKEQFIAFLPRFFTLAQEISGQPAPVNQQEQINQMIAYLRNVPAANYPTGELWIGRDTKYLRRIMFTKTVQGVPVPTSAPEHPLIFTITGEYSNFNEPVAVEVPANAIPAEEAFSRVMQQMNRPAASVSFKEIGEWANGLSVAVKKDLAAAAALTLAKYQKRPGSQSEYLRYDNCTNYIVSQAINKLTAKDLDALRAKPNALEALTFSENPDNATIKKDLLVTLESEYIQPDIIDAVGFNTILQVDSVMGGTYVEGSPTVSKAACRDLPVATQYK